MSFLSKSSRYLDWWCFAHSHTANRVNKSRMFFNDMYFIILSERKKCIRIYLWKKPCGTSGRKYTWMLRSSVLSDSHLCFTCSLFDRKLGKRQASCGSYTDGLEATQFSFGLNSLAFGLRGLLCLVDKHTSKCFSSERRLPSFFLDPTTSLISSSSVMQ